VGATTFSRTTFGMRTFSKTTFGIKTLRSITTFNITIKNATLSIMTLQNNKYATFGRKTLSITVKNASKHNILLSVIFMLCGI
jgi:hypothetical protein